jgi:hypothetical protein
MTTLVARCILRWKWIGNACVKQAAGAAAMCQLGRSKWISNACVNWEEANGSAMPVSIGKKQMDRQCLCQTSSRCRSHVTMAGILRQLGDLAEYELFHSVEY